MKGIPGHIKKYFQEADCILIVLALVVSGIGLLFITSATRSYSNTTRFIVVQSVAIFIGLCGFIVISKLDFERLCDFSRLIFIGSVLFLGSVLILGVGAETGNVSWLRFGSTINVGIQPSEVVKVCFCVTFAAHIKAVKDTLNHPKTLVFVLAHIGIIAGLIQMQGDTGTAIVFLFMAVVVLFCARLHIGYFIGGGVLMVLSLPLVWEYALKTYQRNRILSVLYPELDPTGVGYQTVQCQTAIGSGQIWGQGLFNGTLTQYALIPEKHTDCIFAVIGEEGGFMACLIVIVLLLLIILRCFYIAGISKNFAGSLVCIAVGAKLLFQAMENIGMCLGVLPIIGITLPFLSYGGSSVMSSFWCLGLVECIYRSRRDINFGE